MVWMSCDSYVTQSVLCVTQSVLCVNRLELNRILSHCELMWITSEDMDHSWFRPMIRIFPVFICIDMNTATTSLHLHWLFQIFCRVLDNYAAKPLKSDTRRSMLFRSKFGIFSHERMECTQERSEQRTRGYLKKFQTRQEKLLRK